MNVIIGSVLEDGLTADEIFAKILSSRGLKKGKSTDDFLNPPDPSLAYLLQEVRVDKKSLIKAKKIVYAAINKGEDILVFGDYDADGLTSTAIMWTTLMGISRGSRARVLPFIPDRHRHGYGLSDLAISDLTEGVAFKNTAYPDFKPQLIITVDNGIVANKQVSKLIELGVKVIVTDHHQPSEILPSADCIIHSTVTSGAGISWLTSLYLSEEHRAVHDMVGICAIGVVADQMPLVGVNRAIVVAGLSALSTDKYCGISALKRVADIENKKLTTYDINYILAPRLNAVGRLDSALDGLRLLCTRDEKQAKILASTIESHNKNRQDLTDKSIKHALNEKVEHNLIVASSDLYHEGIIGLVAGKLVEHSHRPAVVIAQGVEVSKGSARSLPGINITNILRQFSDLFISIGGHEQAAGFSLYTKNIHKLTSKLYKYSDTKIDADLLVKSVRADFLLHPKGITLKLAKLISSLEPFGLGNYKPKFVIKDVNVIESKELGDGGKHLKMVIEKDGITRDAIWFNYGKKHLDKSIAELVFTININTWRDKEYLQLMVDYVSN